MNRFNDDPRYLAWIQENIGCAGWEFRAWSHTSPEDGVTRYFRRWRVVTRDNDGNITENKQVPKGFDGAGEALFLRCDVAARLMARDFPELTPISGVFRDVQQHGKCWMYHCWLVDSRGHIVDPTGRQFNRREILDGRIDSYRDGQYLAAIAGVTGLEALVPDYLQAS